MIKSGKVPEFIPHVAVMRTAKLLSRFDRRLMIKGDRLIANWTALVRKIHLPYKSEG
jgi:hypothetical protein